MGARPATADPPRESGRLTFRTAADVGDAALLDATIHVSAAALDRYTRSERNGLGPDGEARQTLDDLRANGVSPRVVGARLRPRRTARGSRAARAVAPAMGTIGYIGVVPEMRAHRYVDDLLSRGTRTLLAETTGSMLGLAGGSGCGIVRRRAPAPRRH
jgi:hypothetical protein